MIFGGPFQPGAFYGSVANFVFSIINKIELTWVSNGRFDSMYCLSRLMLELLTLACGRGEKGADFPSDFSEFPDVEDLC